MRLVRTLTVGLVASAAFAGFTGTASAHLVDVTTTTTGTCPSGYYELAQAGSTVVCGHNSFPDAYAKTTSAACNTGYTEYSVLNIGLCIDLSNH